MANNFPPTVVAKQGTVELGSSIGFGSLFEVSDLDQGSVVEAVRFRDDGAIATSGYFTVNGVRQNANVWISVDYSDLGSVAYHAGLIIESESFNVQVYDGQYWSNVANEILFTVTPNDDPAEITVTPGSVLAYEERTLDGLFTATDPDGYPIEFYYLVDRSPNTNGGHFTVNGVRQASAQWFVVSADDLDSVRYVAGKTSTPQSENIGIMAYDGAQWTAPTDVRVHTIPNVHDPELQVFNTTTAPNRSIAFTSLINWSDADGNSPKRFGFYDSGENTASGFFEIDGVRQNADQWITFDASIVDRVRYVTSNVSSEEEVFIGVFDGLYWSSSASNVIEAVGRPSVDVLENDLSVDMLERTSMSDLFTQAGDPGPDFEVYEVFDANFDSLSGGLWIGANELENGVWHTLSAEQFEQLEFQGSEQDLDRTLDQVLVRGYNGRFWSETNRINITTDPVGTRSLEATSWDLLDNGTNYTITFSFIDGFNPNDVYPPLPIYYSRDDQEANDTYALANIQRAEIRTILNDMEKHLNIDFVEVPYDLTGPSTLIFGTADETSTNILAHAYLANNATTGVSQKPGDIWFNNDVPEYDPRGNPVVGPGSSFRATAIHEIGHALGLKHPFEPFVFLPLSVDKSYNTAMSYTRDFAFHPEEPSTLMLWDIEQLQNQYGVNTNYNTENDHYFWALDDDHLQAIADAGGIDTLNMTNHLLAENIDLREGRRSSLHGQQNALLIPYGVEIENARGGRGDDTFQGNEIRNRFWGNEGADRFIGGGGNDLLRGGSGNDEYVWFVGDNRDTIDEEALGGVDILEFHDSTGRLDSLEDFKIYHIGNDLRVDLAPDLGQAYGGVVIKDFANTASAVETLRFFDINGNQIDQDIELNSAFLQADASGGRFQRTDFVGTYGYLVTPV